MSIDLGLVQLLGADAVGKPGQRRFRLYAQSSRGSLLMWLEKEQLNSMALAIDHALAEISEGQLLRTEAEAHETTTLTGLPTSFPDKPDYEFQIGQIRLSFTEADMRFQLNVIPLELLQQLGEEPQIILNEDDEISFFFTLEQGQHLTHTIIRVIAAGRPTCPLCHQPLDGGPHSCAKQNGHREIIQIERIFVPGWYMQIHAIRNLPLSTAIWRTAASMACGFRRARSCR